MFHDILLLCCSSDRPKATYKGLGQSKRPGRTQAQSGNHSDSSTQPGSARSKEPAYSIMPEAFRDSAVALTSAVATSFAAPSPAHLAKEAHDRRLKELQATARSLQGAVQKSPKSGKGLFKKMQDRYVAVIPDDGSTTSCSLGAGETDEILKWKNGQLAYWEDKLSFSRGGTPKGFVSLRKIAKVWVCKDDRQKKTVIVKHKKGEDVQELVLCFVTSRDAEEWSYKLYDFISKLRANGSASAHSEDGD